MAAMGEMPTPEVRRFEPGDGEPGGFAEGQKAVDAWKYQTEKVALIPYDRAWPVFPEGVLGHLYLRTKRDGLDDIVFCGGEAGDFDWFVGYFGDPKRAVTQIYCIKEGGKLTPIGYCWVAGAAGVDGQRRAPFGFLFFREYWGRREIRDLVMLGLAYWFEVLKVDVLHGYTLHDNYLARNFSRRFGFTEIGLMPKLLHRHGGLTDARVVMLERKDFEPRLQAWRERQRI